MKSSLPSDEHGAYTEVKVHLQKLWREQNSIVMAYWLMWTLFAAKREPFQVIRIPPEAPVDGK
jgi:hypothetical protein